MLRAGAADLDAYAEAELRQLATSLGSVDTAELAYVLAVASSSDRRRRERLDELHALVADLLQHPEALGADAARRSPTSAGPRPKP